MGYHTDYTIVASPVTEEVCEKIDKVLRGFNGYVECHGVDNGVGEWMDADDTWYDSRKHMIEVSRVFPEVHFILYGEGESRADIWREHYIGGKYQCNGTNILYAPFLPNKLRDPAVENEPSDSKIGYEAEQLWSVHMMLHNCVRELLGENESDFSLGDDQYLGCLRVLTDHLTESGYKVLNLFREEASKTVK